MVITWSLDGSGLLVKRHRGMTLPQSLKERGSASVTPRGSFSDATLFRGEVSTRRRVRLSRRAKRHAKARRRRAAALVQRIGSACWRLTVMRDIVHGSPWHLGKWYSAAYGHALPCAFPSGMPQPINPERLDP